MSSYDPYVPGRPGPERPVTERRAEIEHAPSRGPARRGWGHCLYQADAEVFAVASGICIAIWLLTGAGYFWPIWVMLGTGVPVLLQLRRPGRR